MEAIEGVLTKDNQDAILANAISQKEKVIYMRVGLDKATILVTAANIADERGCANVTLKELANELGVKSPSLYKHISGLEELNKELMLYGWKTLEGEIIRATIGKAKDDAIIAICHTYRSFLSEHKGLFEAMQWYNMYQSDEHLQATNGIVSVLFQVLDAYKVSKEQKVHIVRMLRAFLQGFLSIENNGGYGNPVVLDESFNYAITTIINGISALEENQ